MLQETEESKILWSEQQQAFLDWCERGQGSCILEAVAGAGKTTTLLEGVKRIKGQVAVLAYNKKIADEIKGRLAKMGIDWKKCQAGTVHSFGFSACRKSFERPGRSIRVNEYKVRDIVDNMLVERPELGRFASAVVDLVSLAKQRALGVLGSIEDSKLWFDIAEHFDVFGQYEDTPEAELVEFAKEALHQSNSEKMVLDFDDMVYMPLVHKCRFWQFDVVMVDEAQDTNAARRALIRRLVRPGGRVIAVGDRHQAIYGFTGADADSLDLIARDFDATYLPLTVSYRCPKNVVQFAQTWVSHIQAHENAPEGVVRDEELADFMQRKDLDGNSAVLCRNTKPLVWLAMRLIRRKVPCRIEGREIGQSLAKLAKRWKVASLDDLEDRLDAHLERETAKLVAKRQESRVAIVEDQVETLRCVIEECRSEGRNSVADVVAHLENLFGDNVDRILVLSTIHKSKGREWDRVFWFDRAGTCPSKWARQAWQQEQERNLQYVAATRAKQELVDLWVDE